jgi:NitT/TauT family transport system ATP-binding protein
MEWVTNSKVKLTSTHNSHGFDLHSPGSADFQAAAQRIHRLLFDEAKPSAAATQRKFA